MYVRDARNRDEAWLLEHIEAMGLDDVAFRSRDYVIAVDEEQNQRAGFGRLRVHKTGDGDEEVCELTGLGVLEGWRDQGVGAHVVERLVDEAGDEGFEYVYSLTDQDAYLEQFGFGVVDEDELPAVLLDRLEQKRETIDEDTLPLRLGVDAFEMPSQLRERFKSAAELAVEDEEESEPEERPEDFGIDPEEATYKYDTGGD